MLDRNKDGYIQANELKSVLDGNCKSNDEIWNNIIS